MSVSVRCWRQLSQIMRAPPLAVAAASLAEVGEDDLLEVELVHRPRES